MAKSIVVNGVAMIKPPGWMDPDRIPSLNLPAGVALLPGVRLKLGATIPHYTGSDGKPLLTREQYEAFAFTRIKPSRLAIRPDIDLGVL